MTLMVNGSDILGIVADRDQGIADHLGIHKSQYLDWLKTEGLPRCGATTEAPLIKVDDCTIAFDEDAFFQILLRDGRHDGTA